MARGAAERGSPVRMVHLVEVLGLAYPQGLEPVADPAPVHPRFAMAAPATS
jgi:hypothetical protein